MASVWQNLLGTVEDRFQFLSGKLSSTSANIIRSVANAIEARNANDSAYIVGRGADPVASNDWVTLGYANTNFSAAASVREIRFTINNTGGTSASSIPAAAIIVDAEIRVNVAYDPASTIAVARGATTLMATSENNPEALGLYCNHQDTVNAAGGTVSVTVTGSAAGSGVCIVRYVETPLNLG